MPEHAATAKNSLLSLLGDADDPAALSRAMARLARLCVAEHQARAAAVPGNDDIDMDASTNPRLRTPANGLAGGHVVPPLGRARTLAMSGAVITEGDR